MRLRINIITIAVDDLERSLLFYRDGLGLPTGGIVDSADHVAFELQDGLSLVLYPRTLLSTAAGRIDDGSRSAELILTHVVDAKGEVDELLERAEAAGATRIGQPKELSWGYLGYFKDPDGHLWELMWNPGFSESLNG